jgi:hypothetical protein
MNEIGSIFSKVYEFKVSEKYGREYIPMIEDVSRIVILQFVVQLMFFIRSPYEYHIFDGNFIELVIYLVLGLCVYWLIFKRLVKLT